LLDSLDLRSLLAMNTPAVSSIKAHGSHVWMKLSWCVMLSLIVLMSESLILVWLCGKSAQDTRLIS
jgi:hypothetical protein